MSEERWGPVLGGHYSVSSIGRVRRDAASPGTRPGKILKVQIHPAGYRQVTLTRDGIDRSHTIHALVAEAFFGPCPAGHEINHKNFDRADNRIENLEYVTHAHNVLHSIAADRGKIKLKAADVRAIRNKPPGVTLRSIADALGVHRTTVERAWRGETRSCVK